MIRVVPGLDVSDPEAAGPADGRLTLLVNTVNSVGVMGKGVAKAFADRHPQILAPYKAACEGGMIDGGALHRVRLSPDVSVINMATKDHWRDPSHEDDVAAGLTLLALMIRIERARGREVRVLMPMPGCGNGGLSQVRVARSMGGILGRADAEILVSTNDEEAALALESPPSGFYAGVGSRDTPRETLEIMEGAARALSEARMTLRSGRARGADQAFGNGACPPFAPRARRGGAELFDPKDVTRKSALRVARAFHPAPERIGLTPGAPLPAPGEASVAARLMARNLFQVIGKGCDQVSAATACWTEGGRGGGGTGQAIRISRALGVPVFDLGAPDGPRTADELARAVLEAAGRSPGPDAAPSP